MRSIPTVLLALVVGVLASAPLAVSSGCGGCGTNDVKATVSPATSCLSVHGVLGWGCDDSAVIEGRNSCAFPMTIAKAGTYLSADEVVPAGSSFSVDVVREDTGVVPQKSFAIAINGATGTIDVAW